MYLLYELLTGLIISRDRRLKVNKAVKVRKSLNIKNMKMKCRTKQTFHSHFYSDFSIKKK